VKTAGWSALAAWVALTIGLINLWFAVIVPRWRARQASPHAQLDLLNFTTPRGVKEEARVVVTNNGPALMQKIEVEVLDEDGTPLTVAEPDLTALGPTMPVERLHVGQSLYMTLNDNLGSPTPRGAVIRWHDRRRNQQSRFVDLSYNRVL
jgi:hypothetical protein